MTMILVNAFEGTKFSTTRGLLLLNLNFERDLAKAKVIETGYK
jgi:hypothetical protein